MALIHRVAIVTAMASLLAVLSPAKADLITPTIHKGSLSTFNDVSDLDLEGTFLYALDFGRTGGTTVVGGLTFTGDNVAGVTITGGTAATSWGNGPNYDGNAGSFTALETMMRNIRYQTSGSEGGYIDISLANMVVGQVYKLQILFNEGWGPGGVALRRAEDIYVEGALVVDELVIPDFTGVSSVPQTSGVLYTYTFKMTDTQLNIRIADGQSAGTAAQPLVNALTVEAVPEPATMAFLALGGLAMAGGAMRRGRKAA